MAKQNAATDIPTVNTKRTLKVRPTPRQRRAAQLIVDSALGKRPDIKNSGDIVLEAGYAATVKEVPHKVLETSGVYQALEERGFNPETAKEVVKSIMLSHKAKDSDRLKASDMVFKVHGTYAAERNISLNIATEVSNERLLELAERLRNTGS